MPNSPIPSLEEIAIHITDPIEEGPPDLIPGLLPRHGQLLITGETETGKSLISLEICSSLITGTSLWGELTPTHRASRILYVLGEHYAGIIQGLWRKTQLPFNDQVFLLAPEQLKNEKYLVTSGVPNKAALARYSQWAQGCDLIIFDPLSAFGTGIDENDSNSMRMLLDQMSLVAQVNHAACLINAHKGKPFIDKMGHEHARQSYATRGASGTEDAATNIFYLNRVEGDSKAAREVPAEYAGMIFELVKRKYKGLAPDKYRLLRNPETFVHTLLGSRPFVDVQRTATESAYTRLKLAFPQLTLDEVITAIAKVRDTKETIIKRHLGLAS